MSGFRPTTNQSGSRFAPHPRGPSSSLSTLFGAAPSATAAAAASSPPTTNTTAPHATATSTFRGGNYNTTTTKHCASGTRPSVCVGGARPPPLDDDRCLLDYIRASDTTTSTTGGVGSCDGLRVFADRHHHKKGATYNIGGGEAATKRKPRSVITTPITTAPTSSSHHHTQLHPSACSSPVLVVEDAPPHEPVLPVYGAFKVLDAKRVSSNYSHQTVSYGRHNLAASLQSQLLVFPPEASVPTFGQAVVARGSWEVFPDATEGLSVLDSYAPFIRHRVGLRDALKTCVPQGMVTDTDTKKSNHKHLAKLLRRRERRGGGGGGRRGSTSAAHANDDDSSDSSSSSTSSDSGTTSSDPTANDSGDHHHRHHRTHRQYSGFSLEVESDDEEDEAIPQHLYQTREMKIAERHAHLSFRQWSSVCVSYCDDSLVAAGDVDGGLGIFRLRPDAAGMDGSSQLELVHCVDTVDRIGQLSDQYELATRGSISIGHHIRTKSNPAHPSRNLLMSQVFGGITSLTSTPLQPNLFYGGCCGSASIGEVTGGGRPTPNSSAQSLVLPTVLVFDVRTPSLLVQRTPIHYLGVNGSSTIASGHGNNNHLASGRRSGGGAAWNTTASSSSTLPPNLVTSLAINCTGSLLSVGTSQGGVGVSTVADVATCIARLSMDGGFGQDFSSSSPFSHNNNTTTSTDNNNVSSSIASAVQSWGGGVKGLAWSPVEPHELTIGGGTGDGILRTYNLHEKRLVRRVETGSQIVQVAYSAQGSCVITTHGLETKPIYAALQSARKFQERLLNQQQYHPLLHHQSDTYQPSPSSVPLSTEALQSLTSRQQQHSHLPRELSAASLTRSSSSLSSLSSSTAHSPVEVSISDFDGAFSSATITAANNTALAAQQQQHRHSSVPSQYHQPRPSSSSTATMGGGGGMGLATIASSVDAADPLRFGTAAGAALAAEAAATSRGNSPLLSMTSFSGLEGTLSVRDVRRESSSNGLVGLRQSSSSLYLDGGAERSAAAAVHATVLRSIRSSDRLSPLDGPPAAGSSGRTESPFDRRASSHPATQQVTIPPNSVVVWSHGSTTTTTATNNNNKSSIGGLSSLHPRHRRGGGIIGGDDGSSPTSGTRAWNNQIREAGMLRSSSNAASSVRSSSAASCSSSEDGRSHHLQRKTTALSSMNSKVNKLLIPDVCDPENAEEASGWVVSALLKHHSSRPLTLSRCRRDGNSGVLASVAGDTDGTLRLWRLFDPIKKTANREPYITPQGERSRYRPTTTPPRHHHHHNNNTGDAYRASEEELRVAGLFSTVRFDDDESGFMSAAGGEFTSTTEAVSSGGGTRNGEEYGLFDPTTTAALRASSRPPSSTTISRPFTPPPPLAACCTTTNTVGSIDDGTETTPQLPPPTTTSTSFPPPPQLLPLLPHHHRGGGGVSLPQSSESSVALPPSLSSYLRSPIRDDTAQSSVLFSSTPFRGGHASMVVDSGLYNNPSSVSLKEPSPNFGSGYWEGATPPPPPLTQQCREDVADKENNNNMDANMMMMVGGGKTRPQLPTSSSQQHHQPFKNFNNLQHHDAFHSIFNLKRSENQQQHMDIVSSSSLWGSGGGEDVTAGDVEGGMFGGGFASSSSVAFEFGLASSSSSSAGGGGRPPKPPVFNVFGGGGLDKPRMR